MCKIQIYILGVIFFLIKNVSNHSRSLSDFKYLFLKNVPKHLHINAFLMVVNKNL